MTNESSAEWGIGYEIAERVLQAIGNPEQDSPLAISSEVSHYITLTYGDVTLYVYLNGSGVDIQARGSVMKRFEDTWGLAALIQGSDEKTLDRFRDRGEQGLGVEGDGGIPRG